ncbi:NADP-reducing hydrogenase subunit HndA [Thalassovita autumnalis]|uniref:NADP-reducing hydrogenase subunit HndA n=1 Tax=Thalassovita autumnalis TaxID=2072972 RepID=A0A0N7LUT2_9RHOB|nr:formate dehydrogenase subunit gamma [Thalassovita autumnalis]CUH64370.1 NADP-reducing hydrogenase subunit HndA [Thalassovita autumnalis]CUH74381.1 NADP-reducing hydrogenase subunit HndA [Thalassovita autumnalis]
MPDALLADTQAEALHNILAQHVGLEGPLLPILHAVQEEFDHIPAAAVPVIADHLNIGRAEVHGVVSFYHDFRDLPAGRHVVKICRAEACQAMGVNQMADDALQKLGLEWHGTSKDGAVTIEPVYCLGLCASGPAAMVDDTLHGRLTAEKLETLLAEASA